MPKLQIIAGVTTFRHQYADGNPLWIVTKARGRDTWECVIGAKEADFTGTRKVFGGEEIRAAVALQEMWADSADEHEAWWQAQQVGATVHYRNGFGQFVRGIIVGGVMCPVALVGNWREYDLPRRDAAGRLVESYHVRQIRDHAEMQPNFSNMVEAVGVRPGEVDPRGQPAIDLTVPKPSAEQRAAADYAALRDRVQALLATADEYRDSAPYSEALRTALIAAREALIAAGLGG